MPSALLRACSSVGCPNLSHGGPCQTCAKAREQRRGSAHTRGYTRAWEGFRARFKRLLIAAGIAPVCGASLPDGPDTRRWSRCLEQQGWLNDRQLHLDHEPPLTEAERANPKAVLDARRVGFLCQSCHAAKTMAQTGAAA